MRLRKLRGLTEEIEKHPDDYDRLRNVLAIHGGPLIDPSDYSSLETVIRLVRWLNAYPRSGGIA